MGVAELEGSILDSGLREEGSPEAENQSSKLYWIVKVVFLSAIFIHYLPGRKGSFLL